MQRQALWAEAGYRRSLRVGGDFSGRVVDPQQLNRALRRKRHISSVCRQRGMIGSSTGNRERGKKNRKDGKKPLNPGKDLQRHWRWLLETHVQNLLLRTGCQ